MSHSVFHITSDAEIERRKDLALHTINLKEFDTNKIKRNNISAVVSKRSTGKTTLIKKLLKTPNYQNSFPTILFSRNERFQCEYQNIIPSDFIYEDIDRETLERIWNYASQNHTGSYSTLVIEDTIYFDFIKLLKDHDKGNHVNNILKKYFNNYMIEINLLVATQYLDAPIEFIQSIDYLYIRPQRLSVKEKNYIYHNFWNKKRGMETFNKLFDSFQSLEDKFLVIDTTGPIIKYFYI